MRKNKLLVAAVFAGAIGVPTAAFAEGRNMPQPMTSTGERVAFLHGLFAVRDHPMPRDQLRRHLPRIADGQRISERILTALGVRLLGQELHLRGHAEFVLAHPDSNLVKRGDKIAGKPECQWLKRSLATQRHGLAFCVMRDMPATGHILWPGTLKAFCHPRGSNPRLRRASFRRPPAASCVRDATR